MLSCCVTVSLRLRLVCSVSSSLTNFVSPILICIRRNEKTYFSGSFPDDLYCAGLLAGLVAPVAHGCSYRYREWHATIALKHRDNMYIGEKVLYTESGRSIPAGTRPPPSCLRRALADLQHVGVDGEADVGEVVLQTQSWDVTEGLMTKKTGKQRVTAVPARRQTFTRYRIELFYDLTRTSGLVCLQ